MDYIGNEWYGSVDWKMKFNGDNAPKARGTWYSFSVYTLALLLVGRILLIAATFEGDFNI